MELRASSSRVAVTVMPSAGSANGGSGCGCGGVCAAAGATAATRPETNARLPTRRRMASPHDPPSKRHRYNITIRRSTPMRPSPRAVRNGVRAVRFRRASRGASPAWRLFVRLLQGGDACLGNQVVLRAGAAAQADGADYLAADHLGIAAARGDHVVERRQIVEVRT